MVFSKGNVKLWINTQLELGTWIDRHAKVEKRQFQFRHFLKVLDVHLGQPLHANMKFYKFLFGLSKYTYFFFRNIYIQFVINTNKFYTIIIYLYVIVSLKFFIIYKNINYFYILIS